MLSTCNVSPIISLQDFYSIAINHNFLPTRRNKKYCKNC